AALHALIGAGVGDRALPGQARAGLGLGRGERRVGDAADRDVVDLPAGVAPVAVGAEAEAEAHGLATERRAQVEGDVGPARVRRAGAQPRAAPGQHVVGAGCERAAVAGAGDGVDVLPGRAVVGGDLEDPAVVGHAALD